jgi:hypothetical protein
MQYAVIIVAVLAVIIAVLYALLPSDYSDSGGGGA